jgi:transketolase
MIHHAGASHAGPSLSIADILTVAYGTLEGLHPSLRLSQLRTRFILSKGHAAAALYATLREFKFFEDEHLELNFGKAGSDYMTHASSRIPGVEVSTGSLGHGLPIGVGMALSIPIEQRRPHDVIVLVGDGELQEGTTWESLLIAAHLKLGNLTLVVDRNQMQSLTTTEKTISVEPLTEKMKSLGLEVFEVDGHDLEALTNSFGLGKRASASPMVLIASTVKGKGVSFMENSIEWHYKTPSEDQLQQALAEVSQNS